MNLRTTFPSGALLLASLPAIHEETLSSNLDAPTNYTEEASSKSWITASFGTGAVSGNLTDVMLLMRSDSDSGTAQLGLYGDAAGKPGTLLPVLSSPGGYSTTLANTTFIDSGFGLAANSTSWIVLQGVSGTFQWAFTDDNTGSGTGFLPNGLGIE